MLDRLPHDAPPPEWPPLTAVRDLELVDDWPGRCRCWPPLPAEARADVVVGGVAAPGYLRWWLSTHPVLDGARPDRLRHPASTELQGLYEPATGRSGGAGRCSARRPRSTTCCSTWTARSTCSTASAIPARTVRPDVLRTVYARLAAALDGVDVRPAGRGCAWPPDRVVADAVVLDAPYLQPLVDAPVVPAGGAPGAVADLLDLPLAGELVAAR